MRYLLRFTSLVAAFCLAHSAVAREHEFRLKKADAQSVMLIGEFNGWKGQAMSKASDGAWAAKVSLPAGEHAYKFLVNGSDWILDPENPKRKTVGGVENSSVEIKEGESSTARAGANGSTPAPSPASSDHGRFDFNILAERKRYDFGRTGTNSTVTTREKWGYKVTIENKLFAPVSGLEVQYRQFKFDDQLKGSQLIGLSGSTAMTTLNTGQKFTFETTPVEIERLELRPDWVWTDESKEKVKDRLVGLWLRVMREGEIVFEWQNPPNLKSTAKWE